METLIKGQVYNMRVKGINENYDQFPSGGGLKHCHQFTLIMDFDEYDCQICSSNKTQSYCQVGDWVNISVSKFTKNQYTLEKIEVDYPDLRPIPKDEKSPEDLIKTIRETGTEAETAIAVAAKFHAIRSHLPGTDIPRIDKEVIEDADLIYAWLMDKKQNP